MWSLCETVLRTKSRLAENDELTVSGYANGWLSWRHNLETGKFEATDKQEWTQVKDHNDEPKFKLGSHRLRESWFDGRAEHMNKEGLPELIKPVYDDDEGLDVSAEDKQKRSLSTCREIFKEGGMTSEQLQECQEEPWFEATVETFVNAPELTEFSKLLVTPSQSRAARGIMHGLTSQRPDMKKGKKRKKQRELERIQREPLKQETIERMRELEKEGYNKNQISSALVRPAVGKGASASFKKSLRQGVIVRLNQLKKKKELETAAATKLEDLSQLNNIQ